MTDYSRLQNLYQNYLINDYEVCSESSSPHVLRNTQEWKYATLFNIIYLVMHFLHRCLFLLISPKQKSSPKYSFMASMTPSLLPKFLTTKVIFQLWGQREIRGAKSGEYRGWGRTSKPHSVAAAIATCDVWAGALSCKSRTPRVNFPLLSSST